MTEEKGSHRMPHSAWSKFVLVLTVVGALLTVASWMGGWGRWIFLALVGGVCVQAVPVYLIYAISRQRDFARALACIDTLGGRVTARLAADPRCILELDLTTADLSSMNWEALSALDHLESLDLSRTAFFDSMLEHLARLESLRHLHLNGTQITDAGLSSLRELPRLETLALSDTKVTDDGVRDLLLHRPDLQVAARHIVRSEASLALQDVFP